MADERDKDEAELRARLSALSERLSGTDRSPDGSDGETKPDGAMGKAMSQGMRAMGEFVGAVAVSAAIGWQLDKWFGAAPVFLLVFLALGTAAGFWSVYRMAAQPTGGLASRRIVPPNRKSRARPQDQSAPGAGDD